MAELGHLTFSALGIIRVYTKEPGHEPDRDRPFTLPIGATVANLARAIHGDIAEHLKYARIWGSSTFDGQRVKSDHLEVGLGLANAAEAQRCFSCGDCTGCDTCLVYCPEGIIRREGDRYAVDLAYCKGCGICVAECPRKGMEMVTA